MSQQAERNNQREVLGLEGGLEALRRSSEFRGPVESLDGHHCNDHFAQIYESDEERFAASIPFVRHGLERNDRCMYIVDESTEAEVKAAMRTAGLEVDAALETGALSFHTVQETYLRNGTFDPDEMVDFYAETVANSTQESEALRIVAETTWLQEDATTVEQFMEYEAKVNELFDGEDCLAICQYDRDGFPPETIREIVRTHPHLIYEGAVCHNVYYTPPEEFFGPDEPAREVNRMLGTLRERTEAKVELEERERDLRKQNEITASPDQTFEEKLQALFKLGCNRFDLELGAMARVDAETDWFEVEYVSNDHKHFEPGVELPLSETYCTAAAEIKAAGSVADPHEEGYDDIHVYQEFGIEAYLGTYIEVEGSADRTFFFVTSEAREEGFSDDERAFLRLMGQWVKYELEHRQREWFLRESYAITSDPALSFEEKLERLLDLGCEWFGLELAGLNYLPSWDGPFRLEKGIGFDVDPEDEPLWTDPSEGCFCRQAITEDTPVSRADVCDTDWVDDPIHQEFGLMSYLGTKVMSGSTPYGTLWFGSTEPRERPFSDAEHTFIDLMGQWVSYEIERHEQKQSQRELYEIAADTNWTFEEKLHALFELGCGRFDLEFGGMARIDPHTDQFEVEHVSGDHEHLEPGAQVALSETYCRVFTDGGETAGITDPVDDGFDGTLAYDEFGVNAYLGARIELDDDFDRTLFFVSSDPRNGEFSDAERAFLHLMGQWVQYEFEHQLYEHELEETVDQLQQSNGRLQQFAYAASHDLQEPLRMVSSYLQLLENQYQEELNEEAQEYIDFAVDGADRMREMVNDLLAYSQVEQGDGEFEQVKSDAVLERVTDDLQVQIEENNAEISIESLPTVMGDDKQLEQLFSNLISNAIKYNDADFPQVEITVEQRSGGWEFSVADNGIGIDPDKTDRIFEVFKRLHHDDEYTGTGIGLSLCQEIVENHGGEIWVESEPGEGSTFSFTLPKSVAD